MAVRRQKPLTYNAEIVAREDMTDKLAIFRIKPDPKEGQETTIPDFVAGQYIVIGANNEEDPEKGSVRRAYSIASPPEEKRWLEFYVRFVDKPESDNPLTHLLWKMNVGDRCWLGPKIVGKFTLAHTVGEKDERWKIFVAAGTGLAPFVAIVKSAAGPHYENIEALEKLIILHGASYEHDLGYKEDLNRVMNHAKERYFPTVSRPGESAKWSGDIGRVETFFDAESLEKMENRAGLQPGELTPDKAVVYICGLQGTIANTITRLIHRGFIPDDKKMREAILIPEDAPASLFFEQYDSDPVLDLSNQQVVEALRNAFPRGVRQSAG